MKDFLPFHRSDVGEEEVAEVVEVLRSGWLTTGPKVREFEREFAAMVGLNMPLLLILVPQLYILRLRRLAYEKAMRFWFRP